MLKMNKKFILLLVLVLITSMLSGCKTKAPEGISQDFYDDMIVCIKNIKHTDTSTDDKYGNVLKYIDNNFLTLKESSILEAMDNLYLYVGVYSDNIDLWIDDIKEQAEIIANLMEFDVDINKIIK